MTNEEAKWCIGKRVVLEWDDPKYGRESAVALIESIDHTPKWDYLVSDEGLGFRVDAMHAPREAVKGKDY